MRPLLLLFLCLSFAPAHAALPGLADVLGARKLLAPGTWSAILRLESPRLQQVANGGVSGLVFEAASALWLYLPHEGTRSLSTHLGRTEQDKVELDALIALDDPECTKWELLDEGALPAEGSAPSPEPKNACFIKSLALLSREARRLGPPEQASLFSWYRSHSGRRSGHTVLLQCRGGVWTVHDPDLDGPRVLPSALVAKPKVLAKKLNDHGRVLYARTLPLSAAYCDFLAGPRGEEAYASGAQASHGGAAPLGRGSMPAAPQR